MDRNGWDFPDLIRQVLANRWTMVPDIWLFQIQLTRRLLGWSFFSMAAGLLMLLPANPFWNGMGIQCLAWGIIDAAIAWFGARAARNRRTRFSPEKLGGASSEEVRRLARLLWLNTGLDVFYMLGGIYLARSLGASDPFWYGTGMGVLLQGGFLFFFDWLHARRLF